MILVVGGRYQGKSEFASARFPELKRVVLNDIYRDINREEGLPAALSGDIVVIAEENSSGVVPVVEEDIRFREEYNSALLKVAGAAEEVYRVFCGLGMKIC